MRCRVELRAARADRQSVLTGARNRGAAGPATAASGQVEEIGMVTAGGAGEAGRHEVAEVLGEICTNSTRTCWGRGRRRYASTFAAYTYQAPARVRSPC